MERGVMHAAATGFVAYRVLGLGQGGSRKVAMSTPKALSQFHNIRKSDPVLRGRAWKKMKKGSVLDHLVGRLAG
jgi:hypothetical protein